MDIRKLHIFQTAAQMKSFTKAAAALYMTQPAVSKAISELEREAGTLLFERYPKQVVLTPTGRLLLDKSEALLELYREVEQDLNRLDSQSALRIGSCITIANDRLPQLLRLQKEKFPAVRIEVVIASAATVMEKLNSNDLDAAFIEGVVSAEWAEGIPFSSYTIHAVCSPSFALSHPVSSLNELINLPLLMREKGSAIRDTVDSFFLLQGLCAGPDWTSTNANALLQAALQDFGVAFLPVNMIRKKVENHSLAELHLPGLPLVNHTHFVFKKQKHLNEPLQNIVSLVKQQR